MCLTIYNYVFLQHSNAIIKKYETLKLKEKIYLFYLLEI